MPRVYVSVGSNVDKEKHIPESLQEFHDSFGDLVLSSTYLSKAVGFEGHDFHNLVVGFDTDMRPIEIANYLRQVESRHGRVRGKNKFNDRTLDLDILLYDDLVIDDNELEIPRDEITRYAFVLEPLAEIAGDLKHPSLGVKIQGLWDDAEMGEQKLEKLKLDYNLS